MRKLLFLLVCILAISFTGEAHASLIQFTDTGIPVGSQPFTGTLNGNSFSSTGFIISATGDTSNVVSWTFGVPVTEWGIDNTSASIDIAGLGTYDFVTPTQFYVDNASGEVGFSSPDLEGVYHLYDGPSNGAFSTWNMLSSIGPIIGDASLDHEWASIANIDTSGGILTFDEAPCDGTFQATVGSTSVPEPCTMLLLGTGLLGLAVLSRKRLFEKI